MTGLLIKDWQWRANHKQNIVASIEGDQGSGKSIPFLYAVLLCSETFKKPFNIDKNLFFGIEELNEALSKAEPRETFFKDETRQTRAGIMSLMQEQNLADYEEQLRINQNNLFYASVFLENHAHFFCFEAKHIIWNEKPLTLEEKIFEPGTYPQGFISVLKTKRYTDRKQLVWRGLIKFLMPNSKIVESYLKKKTEHITNLQANYSSTLSPIREVATKILNKRINDLIRTTKEGKIISQKSEIMTFVIDEEIGTSKFTIKGYSLLEALIRAKIEERFKDYNEVQDKKAFDLAMQEKSRKEDEKTKMLELLEEKKQQKREFELKRLELLKNNRKP